ncbi:efflux RND transporter periplasmic adaptor subunit [Propionivibrio limicola]|uniref:efflux RND transporter periplasmic adaptor subunit n=1 Tax=Propionivibrio limicola TaxID=167645 RepID=UPI001291F128|nr:efflux RND transporter periplasmic adaptor subunit [Propionivibrio limicola]
MDRKEGQSKLRGLAGRVLARVSPPALGLLIVFAGGGLLLGTWSWSRNGQASEEFISVEVRRGDIKDLVAATGALQPRDYVDVGAQVSGQLKKIHVEVGQTVKEGELLAEIDAEQSAAKVEAALAQLRSLDAQLEQKRLSLVKTERDLARFRNLVAEEAATVESLQNAETEVANMKAQMAQLRAQIDQLRATTRVEQANLKYTKIYAPMSGTVVSIAAKKGQTLNTNQSAPTLMRIADLAVMNVQTQVSEADVSKLEMGMEAYFTTLGGQGRRWYGKLMKIEPTPTVTNNVVLYNALFEVPNDTGMLMTQMTAQVFFVVAQVHKVLVIPMSALSQLGPADETKSPRSKAEGEARVGRRDGASEQRQRRTPDSSAPKGQHEARVRVLLSDGSIEERKVKIGVSNRIHAEVISGLKEGDKVVAGVRTQEKSSEKAQDKARGQDSSNRQSAMQQPMPGVPGMPGGAGGMSRGR